MKRAPNESELALRSQGRRRMIGAAVIMAAVVVFLPMLLDHSMRPKLSKASSSDSSVMVTAAVTPLPSVAPVPAPEVPSPAALPEAASPTPDQAPRPAPSASELSNGGKFVVQVGVFSDREKAKSLVKKLRSQGFKAYTETVHRDKGEVTRVRIGPYPNHADANTAAAKLQKLVEKTMVIAQ